MHVERFGNGPRVFYCLHGWNGDHRTFLPLLPHMPAGAALVAPDLPGCGRSPAPARWTLAEVASAIARSMVEECRVPSVVVGNCSGGLLALGALLQLRRTSPALPVERVVLIDPFAYWPWYFRVFLARGWGRHAYAATFANPMGRWMTNLSLRSRRSSGTNLTEGFASADHHALWNYLGLLRELGSVEQFAELRMPVAIVHGARTFQAVRRSVAVWKGIWPHAAVWSLPAAGHLPIREAAEELSRVIFEGDTWPPDCKRTCGNTPL